MSLEAVARPPFEASENPPVLVLLHGLAADENDLIGMASDLDPRLYVVSFRAPYESGYGGYAWFRIQFLEDGRRLIDEEQAFASFDDLVSELSGLPDAIGVTPSKLIIGGFSQGAMMAAAVVLQRPYMVDGALLMSGRYLPSLDDGEATGKSLPVLVQHGLYDEVLAHAEGKELALKLKKRGHEVRFIEYPMGHEISHESLRDADEFLRGVIG